MVVSAFCFDGTHPEVRQAHFLHRKPGIGQYPFRIFAEHPVVFNDAKGSGAEGFLTGRKAGSAGNQAAEGPGSSSKGWGGWGSGAAGARSSRLETTRRPMR